MIDDATYKQIQKLAAEGCWYDMEIAEMTGVCTKTVRKYKVGAKANKPKPTRLIPPNMKAEPVWCPVCRTKVYPPCYTCQLREFGVTARTSSRPDVSLELDQEVTDSEGYQRIQAILKDADEDIAKKHAHLVRLGIRRNKST